MSESLSAFALVTLDQLQAHLGRRANPEEPGFAGTAIAVINQATAWMNGRANRILRSTNWRAQVSATVSATANASSLTGSGFTTVVKVGDDVQASFIEPGTRVTAVAATSITIDRPVTAAASSLACSFGRKSLRASGCGTGTIQLPEYPVTALWSAKYEQPNAIGTFTTIALTNYQLDEETGLLEIDSEAFPHGEQNIVLEFQGGYAKDSATVFGHPKHADLEHLALRICEVLWIDQSSPRGRSSELTAGPISSRILDFSMPVDIENDMAAYRRRW